MDTILLDYFESLPRSKQNDILNDTRFDTFRGKLTYYYNKSLNPFSKKD